MAYKTKTYKVRPNGLPPVIQTWRGISVYFPSDRLGEKERVVAVQLFAETHLWKISSMEKLPVLIQMLKDFECPMHCFSILVPLAGFQVP